MTFGHRALILIAIGTVAGSCNASPGGSGGTASSIELARTAVHAALEGGTFQSLLDQAVASSFGAAKSQIAGSGRSLTTEQIQQLEASLRKVFAEVYPREAWEEALMPIFLDAFDREELEEIIAFQRTPLGGRLLAAQAQLATGGGGIGQRLVQSRQELFTKRLGEELTASWGPRAPE